MDQFLQRVHDSQNKKLLRFLPKSLFEKAGKDGEWVAYQTGTSIIGVEADGFEPRRVYVRYQQPSTLIILEKKMGEQRIPPNTHSPSAQGVGGR